MNPYSIFIVALVACLTHPGAASLSRLLRWRQRPCRRDASFPHFLIRIKIDLTLYDDNNGDFDGSSNGIEGGSSRDARDGTGGSVNAVACP